MTHLLYCMVQNHQSRKYYVFFNFSVPVWILSWSCFIPNSKVEVLVLFFFKDVSVRKTSHLSPHPVLTVHPPLNPLHPVCKNGYESKYCDMFAPTSHNLASGTGPTSCPIPFFCVSSCISHTTQKKHIWEQRVSGWMRRTMIVIMQIQAWMERVHLLLLNRIGYINPKDEKRELFSTNNEDGSRGSEDNATRTWSQYFISIVSGKKRSTPPNMMKSMTVTFFFLIPFIGWYFSRYSSSWMCWLNEAFFFDGLRSCSFCSFRTFSISCLIYHRAPF